MDRDELRAVMHGVSPVDGEPLRPAGSNGTRVAGVEIQFAPPKTVSALWATSSEYRRAQIETAHRKAVASALARTEREVALVRRKSKGVVRWEKAERLLAAEFVHTSSRLARDQEADGVPDPVSPARSQSTTERVIDTPERIEDIERRADYMRHHGAQDTTIVKQISDEDTPVEDKRTRAIKQEQDHQREIEAIIKAQRQRQLDWERGIEPERGNDIGFGIE